MREILLNCLRTMPLLRPCGDYVVDLVVDLATMMLLTLRQYCCGPCCDDDLKFLLKNLNYNIDSCIIGKPQKITWSKQSF